MASIIEKLVGSPRKHDELPANYAGGLPAGVPSADQEGVIQTSAEHEGYKTVVEGTGAGYGELKEYEHKMEGESGSVQEEKPHHDKEEKHHTGPLQKLKHKMKGGLAKVRKKKEQHGAESYSSTSSEDEGGLQKATARHSPS
ncbi:hypothetical protein KP509_09G008700 [Ceratopteris richardii]|uniref:Uncharacterized protein n=1 Tax=Ceratopteris richardii TaxID=49495 RepID=A0A8T2U3Z2_CERRI|nr:hypothetical protein KP509_09G008700 [Ceratopteris richardii]